MSYSPKLRLIAALSSLLFSSRAWAEGFVDPNTPQDAQPAGSTDRKWVLTFSDEFNADAVNRNKWKLRTQVRKEGNHDVHWGWKAENVRSDQKTGKLIIETKKDGENDYSSGCLESKGLFEQKYGFFEARLQAPPKNNGHQAAFWLFSDQMAFGKDGAEIDVIETAARSDQGNSTLHWNGYKPGEHQHSGERWKAPGIHDGYHTYGVHWSPKTLQFYFDGKLVWTYQGKGIPQTAEYVKCTVGIIKFAEGDIRTAKLPQRSYFDWVRVYADKP